MASARPSWAPPALGPQGRRRCARSAAPLEASSLALLAYHLTMNLCAFRLPPQRWLYPALVLAAGLGANAVVALSLRWQALIAGRSGLPRTRPPIQRRAALVGRRRRTMTHRNTDLARTGEIACRRERT